MKKNKFYSTVALLLCGILHLYALSSTPPIRQSAGSKYLYCKQQIDSATLQKIEKIAGVSEAKIDSAQNLRIKYDGANKKTRENLGKILTHKRRNIATRWVEYRDTSSLSIAAPKGVVSKSIAPKQKYKYNPKIDQLLNREDSTLFSDTIFIGIPPADSLHIHPRSQEYYYLLRNIYLIRKGLDEINSMSYAQKDKAKSKLNDILKKILWVKEQEKMYYYQYLSKSQREYFNDLIKKYNGLVE